jgi:phospholipid/cholesterol/gamma-HCH transport system permease protein
MVVTEQVDALRMCAADPIDYLVRPRFLASLCMTLVLTVISGFVAYLAGAAAGYTFFGINPRTFANSSLVDAGDVWVGLAKCLAYGAAIPIVSAHAGLTTGGGSQGVGSATTRAVVNSSLAVIFLDFLLSGIGYVAVSPE